MEVGNFSHNLRIPLDDRKSPILKSHLILNAAEEEDYAAYCETVRQVLRTVAALALAVKHRNQLNRRHKHLPPKNMKHFSLHFLS